MTVAWVASSSATDTTCALACCWSGSTARCSRAFCSDGPFSSSATRSGIDVVFWKKVIQLAEMVAVVAATAFTVVPGAAAAVVVVIASGNVVTVVPGVPVEVIVEATVAIVLVDVAVESVCTGTAAVGATVAVSFVFQRGPHPQSNSAAGIRAEARR